ncbi:hypothetical protein CALVIDRAFT_568715 [Calocera viscosa TUFC12733]|uniref:CSC1/OSCA1-like 7TM region domain-containing protein n=1 Tax=Calocera viscosa (strain TUFC12733) TaxID=1330018 RepID=A0A167GRR7_CALVF|nr:hypothetical protein CALVIDRAFT_568715 [Calocera viscosa TUFC12733]
MFAQHLKKNTKIKMLSASTEVVPEDIIWHNLSMPRSSRSSVSSRTSPPSAPPSSSSAGCTHPSAVVGIIQGILPPVLLAVLFMLLPIILRISIKQRGEPRDSDIERKLWSRFWLFHILHGLLMIAVAFGIVSALWNIGSIVSELPELLVTNILDSTIFFSPSYSPSTPHSFWLGTTGMPRKTGRKSRTQRSPVSWCVGAPHQDQAREEDCPGAITVLCIAVVLGVSLFTYYDLFHLNSRLS